MTLRIRLFWLFVPLLLLTMLSAFWLSERILLSRFDNQDRTLLLNDAERLRSALDFMLRNNLDLLSTYSGWDDSYEFMLGNRPDFPRSNLDEPSLARINFDFMVYLDSQQQVVTEQWLPPDLSEMLSTNAQLRPTDYASLRQDILQLGRRLIALGRQRQLAACQLSGRAAELMDGISSIQAPPPSHYDRAGTSSSR